MTNPRIVFLDVDPDDRARIAARHPGAAVHPSGLRGEALIDACKEAEAISLFITTKCSPEVIEQLPNLTLLCTRSVGYDHIDLPACEKRGVTVCHVPDYGSHVIAEHAFALLLGTMRHISEGHRRVREGIFDYHGLRGMALEGKTIGIVGTGKIGKKMAKIAHGFGMRILAYDVFKAPELTEQFGLQYMELPDMLKESDVVSLHAPSMPATHHMINRTTIAHMKPGAILINTARGSLIEPEALLEALDAGRIGYALLDVLEHEANVKEDTRLVHHPRVVTTPHIAFYADDSVRNMYDDCFTSIDQWMKGETPTHKVNSQQ